MGDKWTNDEQKKLVEFQKLGQAKDCEGEERCSL